MTRGRLRTRFTLWSICRQIDPTCGWLCVRPIRQMYVSIGRRIVWRIYLVLAVLLEARLVFVSRATAAVWMGGWRLATKVTKIVSKFVGVILAQGPPAPRLPRLHTKQRSTSSIENGRLRFANPPCELCRDWHPPFPQVKRRLQFTEQHECLFLARNGVCWLH